MINFRSAGGDRRQHRYDQRYHARHAASDDGDAVPAHHADLTADDEAVHRAGEGDRIVGQRLDHFSLIIHCVLHKAQRTHTQ